MSLEAVLDPTMVLVLELAMSLLDSLIVSEFSLGDLVLLLSCSFLALLVLVVVDVLRLMADAGRLLGVLFFLPLVF